MLNPADIFDKTVSRLRRGHSAQGSFQDEQNPEDAELMKIVGALASLPVRQTPEPAMQRKYALARIRKPTWYMFLLTRQAVAFFSLAVVLLGGTAAAYEAKQSVPGERLFTLKKGAEQLRVKMATDEVSKANLQMVITKKRMEETQEILNRPTKNVELEIAALEELSHQTQSTVKQVETAAKSSQLVETNHPILTSLQEITKQQQELLSQIQPENEAGPAAQTALEASKKSESKVAQIKTIVEMSAAANDKTLIAVTKDPDTILVSGQITAVQKNKVTVEKITFTVDDSTSIKNLQTKTGTSTDIAVGAKVSISGTREKDTVKATEIIVMAPPKADEQPGKSDVKGSATSSQDTIVSKSPTASSSASSTLDSSKGTKEQPKDGEEILENIEEPDTTVNTATGSFIPEDPSPQFKP